MLIALEVPCTNNNAEVWHSKPRKLPGKAHPNIYEAVTLFSSEQAVTEISLMQLAAGGLPKRRRKYRNYEKRLTTIKENYRYIGILLLDQSKAESMSAHALTHL